MGHDRYTKKPVHNHSYVYPWLANVRNSYFWPIHLLLTCFLTPRLIRAWHHMHARRVYSNLSPASIHWLACHHLSPSLFHCTAFPWMQYESKEFWSFVRSSYVLFKPSTFFFWDLEKITNSFFFFSFFGRKSSSYDNFLFYHT